MPADNVSDKSERRQRGKNRKKKEDKEQRKERVEGKIICGLKLSMSQQFKAGQK